MSSPRRARSTSGSSYRDVSVEHLIGVLLKYVPEDRVRSVLADLGLDCERLESTIAKVRERLPRRAPVTHRDPVLRREYEKLYLSIASLREYVSSIDRRVSALERAVERILDQLSMMEEGGRGA